MSEFFQQSIAARTTTLRRSTPAAPQNRQKRSLAILGISAAFATAFLAGCGSNYRPTTTPIVGTGPAAQPGADAVVISKPSANAQGIGSIVDYAGDTISATAAIGPGPQTFVLSPAGSQAWTINVDGTVSNIPATPSLQVKNVTYSTLSPIPAVGTPTDPQGLDPVVGLFSTSSALYALDVNTNQVDVLAGTPDAFKLVVPVDTTPVTMVGVTGATREYAITQGIPYLTPYTFTTGSNTGTSVDGAVACNVDPYSVNVNGIADAIETSTNTVSAHIPLGICPVYAIGSPDTRRIFVLNRGSDNITVINSQINAIDSCSPGVNQSGEAYTCHPTLPLTPAAGKAHAGPVYAEYNGTTGQIVVANYDGNTISIIDVNLDIYGNDGPNFGNTYTVTVGSHPASVTALNDGTRAYTANQSDGTVSIVDLNSHTLEKTLPVEGHPRTVASVVNSLYGKVYAASPDTPFMSIIRVDQDIISTSVLVQGNVLDVRTTSPNATAQNANTVSRMPGAGQPCNLPPEAFTTAGAPLTLANCKVQDPTLFTLTP